MQVVLFIYLTVLPEHRTIYIMCTLNMSTSMCIKTNIKNVSRLDNLGVLNQMREKRKKEWAKERERER